MYSCHFIMTHSTHATITHMIRFKGIRKKLLAIEKWTFTPTRSLPLYIVPYTNQRRKKMSTDLSSDNSEHVSSRKAGGFSSRFGIHDVQSTMPPTLPSQPPSPSPYPPCTSTIRMNEWEEKSQRINYYPTVAQHMYFQCLIKTTSWEEIAF